MTRQSCKSRLIGLRPLQLSYVWSRNCGKMKRAELQTRGITWQMLLPWLCGTCQEMNWKIYEPLARTIYLIVYTYRWCINYDREITDMHYWLCRSMYGRTFDTLDARLSYPVTQPRVLNFPTFPLLAIFLRVSSKLHKFHNYGNHVLSSADVRHRSSVSTRNRYTPLR